MEYGFLNVLEKNKFVLFMVALFTTAFSVGVYYLYIKFLFKICRVKVKTLSDKKDFKDNIATFLLLGTLLTFIALVASIKASVNPYSIFPDSFRREHIELVLISFDYSSSLVLSIGATLLVIRGIYKKEGYW